ncbi:MAG: DUF4411 family protein [Oscillospiraceae bacterium]|nr:DUF4411 family protein [Oscillospiraceae bacterium]
MAETFLLDSNIFITPHRVYYPFDFAQGFWEQLENALKLDNVIILDVVVSEVSKLEDELSTWIGGIEDFESISVKSASFVVNYGKVLSYVQNCGFYREEALRNWAGGDIADPWLVAVAMEIGATIITEETSAGGLTVKNKSRNAKIPDVANHFGIKCENLFYFMRQMKFKL